MSVPRYPRRPFSNSGLSRGFTLLEMLLVLSIAVIAMAVVAPNFSKGLDSIRLSSAAREIASSLRYLRGHAITANKQAEFNLNVKTNVYQLTGKSKTYSVPRAIRMRMVTADTEIDDEDSGTIRFYPDGSSTGGRVTLAAGNRKRLVDVNWLTGQVEMRTEVEN
ncbi:MAG: GspH/FimT family pseudopilin [Methylococcaceae bacterium]|nr:GspH/FimT family pseudopilin [Methylococcaceae bacterium]